MAELIFKGLILEAVSKIALRGRMLQRTHLINRKGVTFAQDRRPLERLSDIFETASSEAQMQRSHLLNACLQGANLEGANLQGAACREWSVPKSFKKRIEEGIGQESILDKATFSGGLKDLDSLVEGLSDEKAKELREKLTPHLGKPASSQLPENSAAITGVYTEKEAERWIAEYNEVMSEVGSAAP